MRELKKQNFYLNSVIDNQESVLDVVKKKEHIGESEIDGIYHPRVSPYVKSELDAEQLMHIIDIGRSSLGSDIVVE